MNSNLDPKNKKSWLKIKKEILDMYGFDLDYKSKVILKGTERCWKKRRI